MRYEANKTGVSGSPVFTGRCKKAAPALTLMEMVIALAIMAVIFTIVLPLFRSIYNSWDSARASAEAIQNGRVLTEHLSRNLAQAVRITAVSESSVANGYIEFENNDANTLRYDVDANNYVQFGIVGDLYELAGPVSQFRFTCYDACDLDTSLAPITDVNLIRCVQVQTTLTNSAALGQDETFTVEAYIRTNAASGTCSGLVGWWKLNDGTGLTAIDSSNNGNDGTLTNMAGDEWTGGAVGGALDFDGDNDYVDTGYDGIAGSSSRTVTFWVKSTDTSDHAIIAWGDEWVNGAKWHIQLNSNSSDGTLGAIRTEVQRGYIIGSTNIADDNWHHVASVFKEDGTPNVTDVLHYVDGVLETTSGSRSRSVDTDLTGVDARDVTIGRSSNQGSFRYYSGIIDDVRIYNIGLSAEEVAGLAGVVYREFTESKAGSDTTSVTIATPSGTSENDLLIAAVATDGDTTSSLAPPGGENWNEVDVTDYAGEVTLGVWWKLADASESPTHQFTWTPNETAYGWMVRFVGHDPADPVDVYATDGEFSGTPTSPAVTTSAGNCLILRLGAFDDSDITVDSPGLSGHTAITMDTSGSGGQVTYQEFTEAKASPGTSLTIPTPGGVSAGDLLVAAVATDGSTSSSLAPPGGEGWTEVNLDDRNGQATLGVWWKLADASESSSHQFTWSGDQEAYGWIMRFTGHNTGSPINASAAQGENSSSPDCPSVTTTVADCLIVRIGGFDDDDITVDAPGLSGHTAITMDKSNTGSSTCSGGAGYVQQAAIGASGISEFSLTGNEQSRMVTIAIAPDPGGGGDPVSGGAGYLRQSAGGDSGTSDFSLTVSQESNMLTLAVAPEFQSAGGGGGDCDEVSP